jgi:hypothetical protein
VVWLVLLLAGATLGAMVGRWWAVLAAAAPALYVTVASELEVPGWVLGTAYGVFAAAGIAAGVGLRRIATRR